MNRVWTFLLSTLLDDAQLEQLLQDGRTFVKGWTAHDQQLEGRFEIFEKRILVVRVNETVTAASGCSIDKLTRFIKDLEQRYQVSLFNRLLVAYNANGKLEVVPAAKIKELLAEKSITEDTIVYNTAVANEDELAHWEQSLKNTWLSKYLLV